MNLILLEPSELDRGGIAVLVDRRARHIREVLRAEVGQKLRVGLLDGPTGEGTVLETSDARVVLECRFDSAPPVPSGLTLLLALPRPKVMKRLWPVLASFGTDEILVVNASRVERNYFDTHWLEPERTRPLLQEGLEQAGLTLVPRVRICRRLKPLLEDELASRASRADLLRAEPGAKPRLTSFSREPGRPVVIAIGPEGGWSAAENDLFARCGFQDVSLGAGTLRSDVACIAALGILTCLGIPHRPGVGELGIVSL